MQPGPTVFAQVLAGLNQMELTRSAARYPMPRASRSLSAYDHFAAMIFAQLTYRESLRGIEACLSSRPAVAYRMGFRGRVTRTNLAYANDHRDWRIFAEIGAVLMRRAQRLYSDVEPPLGLEADLFALDATVIELSMALFPWARWKSSLASVKLNVLLDLRADIPVFASLHEGKRHEVASLDEIPLYPGSYYVMDRGYLGFVRLYRLHQAGAYFVTRLKSNTSFYVVDMITWSSKSISTVFDASRRSRVICTSAVLGPGSPLGWLWTHTMAQALARIATRKTSLGWAKAAVAVPTVTRCRPRGRFFRLRQTT
jgi:hypothetical protein